MATAPGKPKKSFAAVTDDRTRLLVLGSLPGEESLAQVYRAVGRDNDAFILEVRAKLIRDAADAAR